MKWELDLKTICFNAISFNFPGVQRAPLQQEYSIINLNETINTFSPHMKLDKINWILIDDGLLNLKNVSIKHRLPTADYGLRRWRCAARFSKY